MLRRSLFAGAILGLLAGCGSASAPQPTPDLTPATPNAPVATPPADGISLTVFGVRNGPEGFTVPRGSVLATAVDQPNGVVLILSAPSPTKVAEYLRSALPATGFPVTEPVASLTFTFRGHGWSGSFTSSGGPAAILLRPL